MAVYANEANELWLTDPFVIKNLGNEADPTRYACMTMRVFQLTYVLSSNSSFDFVKDVSGILNENP